jgi:murein DD-endopeptidase MepM/ murein hydrolase activator NlpD
MAIAVVGSAGCAETGLACGPGTVARSGWCVPEDAAAPSPICGPGTVARGDGCAIEPVLPDCGDGTVLRGATCVELDASGVYLPFEAGTEHTVSQGNHGGFSHTGASAYAVDFPAPEGTVVAAARPGRALELREDSALGCAEPSCADDANFLVIDHGDGTFGQYWHLQLDGVLVDAGDEVAQGQPVALTGNTGFSTGPHLHFQVRDPFGTSLPLDFVDQLEGVVYPGGHFTSGNVEEPLGTPVDWSTCPADLFAFLGIALDPGLPCAWVDADGATPVSGRSLAPSGGVVVATLADGALEPDTICADGADPFAATIDWGALDYAGDARLAVAAANADCVPFQVWNVGVRLVLGRP